MRPSYFFCFLLSASAFAATDGAQVALDQDNYDFGQSFQFKEIAHDFQVANYSDRSVTLSVPSKLPAGVSASLEPRDLPPGATSRLHVTLSVLDRYGGVSVRVPIDIADGKKTEKLEARLSGFVESILDDGRPGVDLGVYDVELPAEEHAWTLESSSDRNLKILGIINTPDFVTARLDGDGKKLFVKAKATRQLGFSKGVIRLRLNSTEQPETWVAVLVDERGNVIPDQNPLVLGLQKSGSRKPIRLQLTSKNGAPFKVGAITLDPTVHVNVVDQPCLPAPKKGCDAFAISIANDQPYGQITGKVRFNLPESDQVLSVDLAGLFLADDVAVVSLDKQQGSSQTAPLVDVGKSLRQAVTPKEETPVPSGHGPLLSWRVGNEAAIYGYAIFRASAVDGVYSQVSTIVRAKNKGDDSEASYSYRDNTAQSGKEYWYYISIFYNNGKKVQLTGPQKVVAK